VILEPGTDGGLAGRLEYNADLFDAATMERMAAHLVQLLEGAAADPAAAVTALPLLGEAERHRQLFEWNATAESFPACSGIHQLFEAQVARTPQAPALTFEGQSLSYGEVEARANQLARHLQGLGVGPERIVGLCIERSFEMIIGILGC
jgi:non-ribosomal peptide synthetase component F